MLAVSDFCYRCGDCITACPVPGTITNILPGKVRINSFSCIDCNQCIPVCRFGLITKEKEAVTEVESIDILAMAAPDTVDVPAEKKPVLKRKRAK